MKKKKEIIRIEHISPVNQTACSVVDLPYLITYVSVCPIFLPVVCLGLFALPLYRRMSLSVYSLYLSINVCLSLFALPVYQRMSLSIRFTCLSTYVSVCLFALPVYQRMPQPGQI